MPESTQTSSKSNFFLFTALVILYVIIVWCLYCYILNSNAGVVGDFFGGLLSPVIGIISLGLIYHTFRAQRLQLVDQQNYNKVQTSLVYYTEFKLLFERVLNQTNQLTFRLNTNDPLGNPRVVKGTQALERFIEIDHLDKDSIGPYGNQLLHDINKQLRDLIVTIEQYEESKELLSSIHKTSLRQSLNGTVSEILENNKYVYSKVNMALKQTWDLEHPSLLTSEDIHQGKYDIRTTVHLYKEHLGHLKKLEELGYLKQHRQQPLNMENYKRSLRITAADLEGLDLNPYSYIIINPPSK